MPMSPSSLDRSTCLTASFLKKETCGQANDSLSCGLDLRSFGGGGAEESVLARTLTIVPRGIIIIERNWRKNLN